MAKKKKDPLGAAAQQVVKKTTDKVVKQTTQKRTAEQKVRSAAKGVAGNIVKNKAPGTVKKKTANRSLKASNISGNTGKSVKKRDRDKTAKNYATMNQAKRTAKSNVIATQKGEKVMGGNAVQRNVLQKNKPTRLSRADDFMLTDRGKNEVNNAKALYEVARRNNDEAGMKLAHGMAELARLNNQTRRRNDSGDIVGPYSGGTWGDRYIEANMGNFNTGQTGLREPEKNFLRSEAYQVRSALNEAGAGYLNTLREFPLRHPEGQSASQLIVKGDREDKYSSDIVDRRGQSRYTEEDMANKALQFQQAADAQRELGYQTTPINGFAGRFLGDATRVATGIGLDALANTVVPGAGLVNMGARTWGTNVKQAKDEQKLRGTDKEPFADLKAYMYGTAMTGVEIATEKMFDGVKLFGKSVYGAGGATTKLGKMMDDVFNVGINRAVARLAKTPGGEAAISALMNIGKSGLEEGLEELVADLFQWRMPKIYGGDVEGAKEMLTGALYDFALGAAMGGFGGVTSTGSSMREAYLDRTNRNAEAISDRMSELGADKEQAKTALSRMTIYQLESLAEASDDVLRNTGMVMGLISSENANQSLTEASEEQRSEQTVEGGTEPTTSDGAAWKKLRKRLRDAEVRDAETLKAIRSKLTPEEMEEAAGLRKNDFLEWRDRVMSPDYKGSRNAVQEAPAEVIEEEDDAFAITPEDIRALGNKLERLGVKGPEIARAVSDDATIEQLINMDEEELLAWAQEQTAPAQPEALAEQTELLEAQRQERQEEAQAPATPLERSASVLGAAGRTAFISSYNPSKRSDLYTAEAYRAYNAGFTGNVRPTLYRTLNRASSEALYQAGVIDRLSSMRARENNKRNAISFDQETAGIDLKDKNLLKMIENAKDYEGTALQFNEADAKHLNRLLKALGKKGFFVESIDDMSDSAKRNIANGSYENGIVLFSLQTNRPISFVIGHEITHAMAEMSPKEYKRLEKYVASTEKFEEKVERIKAIYKGEGRFISQETAIEEVVADYVGEMVTDLNMLEEFARRADRNMLQKFLDALKSVARKLTGKDKADVNKAIKLVENLLDTSVKQNKRMAKTQRSVEDIMASNDTGGKHSIKSLFESAGIYVKQVDGRILATGKNGKAVTEVTTKMVQESGIGALINYAYEETGSISKEDAEKQIEGARDLLNMILNAQDGELVWRFAGSAMFSAVKTNSDGQYGTTIDFSTVCRKTQEMMTAMSESMMDLGRGLTKDEVIELQAKILTEGGTVPCPVCYVFSRWAGIGGILDNMSKFQEKYGHEYDDPAKLNARIKQLEEATKNKDVLRDMLRKHDTNYIDLEKQREELETNTKAWKEATKTLNKNKPSGYEEKVVELEKAIQKNDRTLKRVKTDIKKLEAEGAPELAWLNRVRKKKDYWEHGVVPKEVLFNLDDAATFAESYPLAWGYRTSRGPSAGKAILPYSDMRLGDLILGPSKNSAHGKDTFKVVKDGQFNKDQRSAIKNAIERTKAQNLIGGQRFQSTSDFRYDYGLDYLQVFWEAQALGSNMQTYTKIIEFAELVAAVGGDVNISMMPLNSGLDENGNLLYSNVTGVDIEAAEKASKMYDSAQLILVGINDDHIRAALDDKAGHGGDKVGFVIPYHASGASINEFIRGLVENLRETFNLEYYKDYSLLQEDHVKSVPGANGALVSQWMEEMRKNPIDPQFSKNSSPNAEQRKALEQKLRSELRSAILKHKIGSSRDDAENLLNNKNVQEFMRKDSKDIGSRSFEELLDIERRALAGESDAIQEYESWSSGMLWDLYQKMWVDKSSESYGVELNTDQAASVMPHEYWNKEVNREHAFVNGFLFRSYCYNLGLVPRFTGLTSSGTRPGHGDFSDSTGYWKLLIDRPMYDNQGRYRDQQKINATNITKEMLTPTYGEEKWGDFKVREPSDKVARAAAKRFVEEKRSGSKPDIRWSIRDDMTYDDYIAKYGSIKPGERRARNVAVPKQTSDNTKVHQTIRTIMEAGRTPEDILPRLKEMIESGEFSYEVFGNREGVEYAQGVVAEKGFAEAYKDWSAEIEKKIVSPQNVAMGWVLYDTAVENKDWDMVARISMQMAKYANTIGQGLQAMRILKMFSPEMQLAVMDGPKPERVRKKLEKRKQQEEQPADTYDEEEEEDDDIDLPGAFFGEEDEERPAPQKKPRKKPQRRTPREEQSDTNEDESDTEITQRDVEETAEYQAKQHKSSFLEMWNSWRYLAMLFNARTHIRNIVGNLGFAPIVMSKNITATAAEIAIYHTVGRHFGMKRTKGVYNPMMFAYGWKDFEQMRPTIMGEAKYEGQEPKPDEVVFRGILAPLEKARKLNSAALDLEDAWFSRPQYANALAQYMAANGITVEMMETGAGEITRGPHKGEHITAKIMDEARSYAVKEAQKATYRDLNDLSQFFMRVGKPKTDDPTKVERVFHVLIEGVIPFRKTPANILVRAMEYSPVGFAHGMKKLLYDVPATYHVRDRLEKLQEKIDAGEELTDKEKKFREKASKFEPTTVAEALDRICSGMSGTAIFALGMTLAKLGILVAKTDNGDDDQKYFTKLLGHQQWAVETPEGAQIKLPFWTIDVGGLSFTIDWLAPEVVPLFMGAQYFTGFRDGDPIRNFSSLADSLSMVIDPVLELSCMSGIQEALNNAAAFSEGDVNTMVGLASSLGLSYFSQGIPTLFGQLERASQEERMTTFTQDEQLIPSDWQYQIGKLSAKIPVWDYHQIPYVDSWGNTETETSLFKRIVANMFNPAYVKKIDTRAVNKELQRLYDATGDGNVLPSPGWKNYNYTDENGKNQTVYLSEEEYLAYGRAKGRTQFDLVDKFVKSKAYKSMTDSDRVSVINEIYNYAEYKAQQQYIHDFKGKPRGYKVEDYEEFASQYGNVLSFSDYVVLDKQLDDVQGLKSANYKNGQKTIMYTKSDNLIISIHNSGVKIPTDQQEYEAFMSAFGVADSQKGWSKSKAEEDLAKQKRRYGITD